MRTKLIVLCVVLPLGGTVMLSAAGAEPYRGTWEQQMACTPDVWRLCASQIPDVDRIVGCLRQNTPSLSDSCRAVFEANNSANQPAAAPPPRGRVGASAPSARTAPPPPARVAPPPRPSDNED